MENTTILFISSLLLIVPILIIIGIFSFFVSRLIIFLRIQIRRRMMEKFARKFNLNFKPNIPSFGSFSKKSIYKDLQFNHIEGSLGGHSVKIHDYYHFSFKFFYNRSMRETFIEIDGKQIKGGYRSFKLGDAYLTPIYELSKILKNLK